MSMTAAAAKAAKKIIISMLTKRRKRGKLLTACLVPVVLVVLIMSFLFYRTPDPFDPYLQAVDALIQDYGIKPGLDGNLVRTIQLLNGELIDTDVDSIQDYIKEHFVIPDEQDIEVDGEVETISIYRFLTFDEILNRLREPPFSFDDARLAIIEAFPTISGGADATGSIALTGPYLRPCEGYISSPWGMREDPLNPGTLRMHYGLDIRGEWHQPIYAITGGVVTKASRAVSRYGNFIIIRHNTPEHGLFYSLYAHLSELGVKEGDRVTQGQVIGREGGEPGQDRNAGDSTGHHLHLEIQNTGPKDTRDPAKFVS